MKRRVALLLTGILNLPALLRGQAATPLTLEECIRRALAAPSPVSVAKLDNEIANKGLTAARSNFFPSLSIANGYTYNTPNGSSPTFIALNAPHEYLTQAVAGFEVDTSGRLRAAYARARADQRISQAQLQIIERDLKRSVTASYYRLLLARHLVTANEELLSETATFAERIKKLLAGGEVARADAVKAEQQVAFQQQALAAAKLDARLANQELASFWTSDLDQPLEINDTLENPPKPPEPPRDNAAAPYLRRLEFNLLEAERQGFDADRRRERAALFPQLTFSYQYGIDAPNWSWANSGSAFFATFNIPVFDFFRARSLSDQFKLRMQQVDLNREMSVRAFSREYASALGRVRLLYEQVDLTRTQVRTSEENLKLAHIRYDGGEGPALDVVVAVWQLSQAQTNYFTLLANYANALADLEVASGR
jgi:outer membrane protein